MSKVKDRILTPTNKELAVNAAKDALQQLDAKKILATQGDYFKIITDAWATYPEEDRAPEGGGKICKACAIGSMWAGLVGLETNGNASDTYEDFSGRYDTPEYRLGDFIGEVYSRILEIFFEDWGHKLDVSDCLESEIDFTYSYTYQFLTDRGVKASDFDSSDINCLENLRESVVEFNQLVYDLREESNLRIGGTRGYGAELKLRAILNTIIANDGVFNPTYAIENLKEMIEEFKNEEDKVRQD